MIISLLTYLLISTAVSLRRDKSILLSRSVILGVIFAAFIAFNDLYVNGLGKGIGIYAGLFNVTTFTQSFNIFILLISALILTLNSFYPKKLIISNKKEFSSLYKLLINKFYYNETHFLNKTSGQFSIIEYPLIIVFIVSGALFLISTGDLVSIFLSIELQSYGLYILSTLYRDSESATASGLTYFLLGGLSSCFILLGSALLYANSGTTNLDNIYVISSISQIAELDSTQLGNSSVVSLYEPYYLHLSLIIMATGFLFKVSAAPFHFWSPDVYDGIPTIVTTYVAIVPKISIFAFFLELVYYTESFTFDFTWKNILLLSSLFSLIVGSVLGLTQSRIKRLFAYSTISHVGFILLALSINNVESIQAYIFYILQYSISNLNAFILLVTIGFSLYPYLYKDDNFKASDSLQSVKDINVKRREKKANLSNHSKAEENIIDQNNSPVQLINQVKGYFYINQFIAVSLAITLFSFVGVPPLIGFFAKQMILSAALDEGYVFMALVAILTSVIGAAYYLNLIKQIFFYKSNYQPVSGTEHNVLETEFKGYMMPYNASNKQEKDFTRIVFKYSDIKISSSLSSIISILTLLLVLFIYVPSEWFNIVSIISLILFKS